MFKDKSNKVMVVEQSGSARQLLSEVLKYCGYQTSRSVANLKDAVGILEVEAIDWIITGLFKDSSTNALQLLHLISSRPVLRHTRVSFILEESELRIISTAYEKGLLHHIMKPFKKDTLIKHMEDFHNSFAEQDWIPAKLAGIYLRKHLVEKNRSQALINLEQGLLKTYPGEVEYLLNMTRPQLRLGMKIKAISNLKQALLIAPEREEEINKLASELFGEEAEKIKGQMSVDQAFNSLGINKCVVIDSDDSARKMVGEIFKNFGVKDVLEFEDGESAWQWLDNNKEVDLIFQEWKIPKLTGPLLIQRIRKKFSKVPIITLSSVLEADDLPLVQEMGVSAVAKKPIDRPSLAKIVVTVIQQDRMPTEARVLEQKLRRYIEARDFEEARKLHDKLKKSSNVAEAIKETLQAEFFYAEGKYSEARDLALNLVKSQKESITVLNLLGKSLMQLRDYSSALRCFTKAQAMSPKNVQRLCHIADASNELGDTEKSNEALSLANVIDAGSDSTKEAEASINLKNGATDQAKEIMNNLNNLSSLISYLNNKAVAYTRSSMFDEGISLYKKTLLSLPDKKEKYKPVVSYNLALAFARADKLEQAIKCLEDIIKFGKSKVYMKAKSLLQRAEKSLKEGSKLSFLEGTPVKEETEKSEKEEKNSKKGNEKPDSQSLLGTISADPGDICCFKIFSDPDPMSELGTTLLANEIRFTARDAIARDHAAGLEKDRKTN